MNRAQRREQMRQEQVKRAERMKTEAGRKLAGRLHAKVFKVGRSEWEVRGGGFSFGTASSKSAAINLKREVRHGG